MVTSEVPASAGLVVVKVSRFYVIEPLATFPVRVRKVYAGLSVYVLGPQPITPPYCVRFAS